MSTTPPQPASRPIEPAPAGFTFDSNIVTVQQHSVAKAQVKNQRDQSRATAPRKGSLVALDGSAQHLITEPITTLGRGRNNRIVLTSRSVSRHHCRLTHTPQGFRLVDEGSHNGTFVNNERISEHDLAHGDAVRLGEVEFIWHEQ